MEKTVDEILQDNKILKHELMEQYFLLDKLIIKKERDYRDVLIREHNEVEELKKQKIIIYNNINLFK